MSQVIYLARYLSSKVWNDMPVEVHPRDLRSPNRTTCFVIDGGGLLHPFPGHELLPEMGSGAEYSLRAADFRHRAVSA